MLSHCPSQMDNSQLVRLIPSFPFTPWSRHCLLSPFSSFNYQFLYPCSLNTEEANYSGGTTPRFLSINRCCRRDHLKETRPWLKHEPRSASLDPPTCAGICSRNAEHVKQHRCALHSHARVPPNTPSVNWSLGSVGSPDSTSRWSGRGCLVLGHCVV